MIEIRPWRIFELVAAEGFERMVRIRIPARRRDYSLRVLELMLLIACMRIVSARRIFEIGTYLGNTTLHLAENSPCDAVIYTLDCEDATLQRAGLAEQYSLRREVPREYARFHSASKVKELTGDSRTFDFSAYRDMDLVFIDGDHSFESVLRDSDNAYWKMLADGGVIAWHDCSAEHPETRQAICEFSHSVDGNVFQVADTHMALYFADPAIVERLRTDV